MTWTDEEIAERIAHAGSIEDARYILHRFKDRLTFDLLHHAADLERALWPKPRLTLIRLLETRARKAAKKATNIG
jgi:hypothetical protein